QKARREGGLDTDARPPDPDTGPSTEPDHDPGAEPETDNDTTRETGSDVTTAPASDVNITTTVSAGRGEEASKHKNEPTRQNGSESGEACENAAGNVESVVPGPPEYGPGTAAMLNDDPEAILEARRQWAEDHAAPLAAEIGPHGNDRTPDRRL